MVEIELTSQGSPASRAEAAPSPSSLEPQRRSSAWREWVPSYLLCDRNGSLLRLLCCDRRALLLAPYNAAFGLTTAFFPSHVTVLTKKVFEDSHGGDYGAAAAGCRPVRGASSAHLAEGNDAGRAQG